MSASPYSLDGLATAREVVTRPDQLAGLAPLERARIIGMAFSILQKDRAARLGLDPAPKGPASIVTIPLAVFQSGRRARRPRPRLVVHPLGPTPGDAA